MNADPDTIIAASSDRWTRWEVVFWLFLAYFLHQADKQIYSVLLKPMQADLELSGFQAGLVSTLFTLVVALMSPLAGALGDRWPQHRIIWSMVLVWSAATAMSGAASGIIFLIATRSLMTAGAESFYPPVSHAYLASWHTRTRAAAISIHQVAQYAGPIASGFLAGWIAEHFGWRSSFYLFGIVGFILGIFMIWRLRSVTDGEQIQLADPSSTNDEPTSSEPLFAGFVFCFSNRAVRQIGLAFAAVLFVSIGYGTWAPTIFANNFQLTVTQAGFQTSLWISVSAMIGAVMGGWLSDHLFARGYSRFYLQSAVLLCAAPFLWVLGSATSLNAALISLAVIGLFKGVYEGTLAVSLYDHVPARHRSSAAAVVLLLANLLAAPSSAVLGWASDYSDINQAVQYLSVFFVLASTLLWWGRKLD